MQASVLAMYSGPWGERQEGTRRVITAPQWGTACNYCWEALQTDLRQESLCRDVAGEYGCRQERREQRRAEG